MKQLFYGLTCLASLLSFSVKAQNIKLLKYDVRTLSGPSMSGRGYIDKGCEKAARYLVRRLKEAGVAPATADSSYLQEYRFPVNAFPAPLLLELNKKELRPGLDYLIDARSGPYRTGEKRVKAQRLDVGKIWASTDSAQRLQTLSAKGGVMSLQNADTLVRGSFLRTITPDSLEAGLYLVPVKGKMTWTVATRSLKKGATVVYVQDSVLPRKVKKVRAELQAKMLPDNRQYNVAALVPGTEKPDSFIVFTAHYDHLGEMGKGTVFPGASDNASGTATVLDLARYYASHPQKYSMLFLFFSGEEAGLLGSKFYTGNPLRPLANIRCLINLDMVGECADGATVVNATRHPDLFSRLETLNNKAQYLPKLYSRGEAANSDHHHFSQAGVPALFIYGNGGKGRYHDVFDTGNELSLTNTENLEKLLIRFVETL